MRKYEYTFFLWAFHFNEYASPKYAHTQGKYAHAWLGVRLGVSLVWGLLQSYYDKS